MRYHITIFSLLIIATSCVKPSDCNSPKSEPIVVKGVVVDDETLQPITNCIVTYRSGYAYECGHWERTDIDSTAIDGKYYLNTYLGSVEASQLINVMHDEYTTYNKNDDFGYLSQDTITQDTIKLSKK